MRIAGLLGALLKLRYLTDPNQPMNFDVPEEETAVHDVMAVIERELGVTSVPRQLAPWPDAGRPGRDIIVLHPWGDPSDEPGPDAA